MNVPSPKPAPETGSTVFIQSPSKLVTTVPGAEYGRFAPVFYAQDFTAMAQPALSWGVEQYSKRAVGGCYRAVLVARGALSEVWRAMGMLRCPVEIRESAALRWWGMVNAVSVNVGALEFGVTMDRVSNSVAVAYTIAANDDTPAGTRATTDYTTDTNSITMYGTKQILLSKTNITADTATTIRNQFLSANAYPSALMALADSQEVIARVQCVGWWDTLAWKYYGYSIGREAYTPGTLRTQNFGEGSGIRYVGQMFALASGASWTGKKVRVMLNRADTGQVDNVVCKVYSNAKTQIGVARSPDTGVDDLTSAHTSVLIPYNLPTTGYIVDWLAANDVVQLYNGSGTEDVTITGGGSETTVGGVQGRLYTITRGGSPLTYASQVRMDLPSAVQATSANVAYSVIGKNQNIEEFTFTTGFTVSTSAQWLRFERDAGGYSNGYASTLGYYQLGISSELGYTRGACMVRVENTGQLQWRTAVPERGDLYFEILGEMDTGTQVSQAISTHGQFLNGAILSTTSGILTTPYRDGDSTAKDEIEALLNQGVSGGRRYVATVLPTREVLISQEAEPTIHGYINVAGDLFDSYGSAYERAAAVCGLWVKPRDVNLNGLGLALTNDGATFIEQATYYPLRDVTEYQPREARDPLALLNTEQG